MITDLFGRCSSRSHRRDRGSPAHYEASWLSKHHEHTDGGTRTDTENGRETTSPQDSKYVMLTLNHCQIDPTSVCTMCDRWSRRSKTEP